MEAPHVVTATVVATFSAEVVLRQLGEWLRELYGGDARVVAAEYGAVFHELLAPASAFTATPGAHGLNIILFRTEDWASSAEARADALARLEVAMREYALSAPLLVVRCKPSPAELPEDSLGGVDARLASARPSGAGTVAYASWAEVEASVAPSAAASSYHTLAGERLARAPYTAAYCELLATAIARRVRAELDSRSAPIKLVAVDCDHTLWDGIVSEDGPAHVRIRAPHAALGRALAAASARGVLVALLSKNDERQVLATIATRGAELGLAPEQLVACRVNWRPKPTNLAELLAELQVSARHACVIDDDPLELRAIADAHPHALCLRFPRRGARGAEAAGAEGAAAWREAEGFVYALWALDAALAVSAEDEARTQRMRAEGARARLLRAHAAAAPADAAARAPADAAEAAEGAEEGAAAAEGAEADASARAARMLEFVRSLELQIRIERAAGSDMARVAQLSQRTNQCNAQGAAYTEPGARAAAAPHGRGRWECVRVADRFGEYGLVGAMLLQPGAGRAGGAGEAGREGEPGPKGGEDATGAGAAGGGGERALGAHAGALGEDAGALGADALLVRTLHMSCRVLHRGVEHAMLAHAARSALELGLPRVVVPLVRTGRNDRLVRFLLRAHAAVHAPAHAAAHACAERVRPAGQPAAVPRHSAVEGAAEGGVRDAAVEYVVFDAAALAELTLESLERSCPEPEPAAASSTAGEGAPGRVRAGVPAALGGAADAADDPSALRNARLHRVLRRLVPGERVEPGARAGAPSALGSTQDPTPSLGAPAPAAAPLQLEARWLAVLSEIARSSFAPPPTDGGRSAPWHPPADVPILSLGVDSMEALVLVEAAARAARAEDSESAAARELASSLHDGTTLRELARTLARIAPPPSSSPAATEAAARADAAAADAGPAARGGAPSAREPPCARRGGVGGGGGGDDGGGDGDGDGASAGAAASAYAHTPAQPKMPAEILERDGRTPGAALTRVGGLEACCAGDLERARALARERGWVAAHACDRQGTTALMWAAGYGRLPVVRWLLEEVGAAVDAANKDGRTALMWACKNGQLDVVDHLLNSARADPTLRMKKGGSSAFDWAVAGGSIPVVELLAAHPGVDIHATNLTGCAPVHWAAAAGHQHVCEWLLARGADFGAVNDWRHGAVVKAAWRGHCELLRWLVDPDAGGPWRECAGQLELPDHEGTTPANLARAAGQQATAAVLDRIAAAAAAAAAAARGGSGEAAPSADAVAGAPPAPSSAPAPPAARPRYVPKSDRAEWLGLKLEHALLRMAFHGVGAEWSRLWEPALQANRSRPLTEDERRWRRRILKRRAAVSSRYQSEVLNKMRHDEKAKLLAELKRALAEGALTDAHQRLVAERGVAAFEHELREAATADAAGSPEAGATAVLRDETPRAEPHVHRVLAETTANGGGPAANR